MKFRAQLLLLSAGMCFVLSVPHCYAQSILNQSSEDLLKDFDVDPNQVANQYQPKPAGKTERLLQMLGSTMPKSNDNGSGTKGGSNNNYNYGPNGGYASNYGPAYGPHNGPHNGPRYGSRASDGGTLRVRAPWVKVDMINGERCIRVDAPFLNYDSNPAMSAVLRNQESLSATMPPAPVSPISPGGLPQNSSNSGIPAATSNDFQAPSGGLDNQAAPTGAADSSGATAARNPAKFRLDRSTALPNRRGN